MCMFTGIIKARSKIFSIDRTRTLMRYIVTLPPLLVEDLVIGASIAVDGVCQTVVDIDEDRVTFEAIEETLKRTTLGLLKEDQWVNIERAVKLGDEIGGHMLSGHVVGRATVSNIIQGDRQLILKVKCDKKWMKYILPKGFVALNGASLTVGETTGSGQFTVHLIPETINITTFCFLQMGDQVNLEIDSQTQAIVDTVERLHQQTMA